MLKSCAYCGKIHDSKFICEKRKMRGKKRTDNSNFRSTYAWTRKSIEIRERDKYICQCCLAGAAGTQGRITYDEIEVHHIEPIEEAWDKRLDNDNLISLCREHHEKAEEGKIDREYLKQLVRNRA